jgi:hypothetical protein
VKRIALRIAREVVPVLVIGIVFSLLFILGHLALYQELPRWK